MDDIWIDLYTDDDTGYDRQLAITGRGPTRRDPRSAGSPPGGIPARRGPRRAGSLLVRAPARQGSLQGATANDVWHLLTFDI